ncbi:hypothetical protein I8752_17980 [Nostocaceae cyanobacterium CENA369]|uniref:PRC-barrel domain-containing protein n=1 Tax=Dendronalium phyllosphericum CENA369 TaxID=1725256 RepID=A0A8J7I332_9NOST|nr:hypothetical protein [Dendronalium phyllosphericum]MBH8574876.1 hypothetical protein [Dendronalium phyllosphericum CENA369]
MTREIHLELLLGTQVLDPTGKPVGRIEEIRTEQQGYEWFIQEYLIGNSALLERLSAWEIGLAILRRLGAHKIYTGYSVPWQQMDLTDPQKPSLRCHLEELESFQKPTQ